MIPSSKLQKITQRLHFGYCQGVFREFFAEKCENRSAGFRLPALGSRELMDKPANRNIYVALDQSAELY